MMLDSQTPGGQAIRPKASIAIPSLPLIQGTEGGQDLYHGAAMKMDQVKKSNFN